MSHIVKAAVQVTNREAIERAASYLEGVTIGREGQHNLYERDSQGLGVQFEGWKYPVVINTESGLVEYDNYNGRWGDQSQLDGFLQRYGVEAAKLAADQQGYTYQEQSLDNGELSLRIQVGSGAAGISGDIGGPLTA